MDPLAETQVVPIVRPPTARPARRAFLVAVGAVAIGSALSLGAFLDRQEAPAVTALHASARLTPSPSAWTARPTVDPRPVPTTRPVIELTRATVPENNPPRGHGPPSWLAERIHGLARSLRDAEKRREHHAHDVAKALAKAIRDAQKHARDAAKHDPGPGHDHGHGREKHGRD